MHIQIWRKYHSPSKSRLKFHILQFSVRQWIGEKRTPAYRVSRISEKCLGNYSGSVELLYRCGHKIWSKYYRSIQEAGQVSLLQFWPSQSLDKRISTNLAIRWARSNRLNTKFDQNIPHALRILASFTNCPQKRIQTSAKIRPSKNGIYHSID